MFIKSATPIPFYQSTLLREHGATAHAFFTRLGGFSSGGEMNLGHKPWDTPEAVASNFRRIRELFGLKEEMLFLLNQTHSNIHHLINDHGEARQTLTGDALITFERGAGLLVRTADCLPLLLYAPDYPAVAAIHAGWRGIINGATTGVVTTLKARGIAPSGIFIAAGPAICAGCFVIREDCLDEFIGAFGEKKIKNCLFEINNQYSLDLKKILAAELVEAGIPPQNLDFSTLCTRCHPEEFYSYRQDPARCGNNGSLIAM